MNNSKVTEMKVLIRDCFKSLRKDGMFARMNFFCCQTCARYDIGKKAKEAKSKAKPFRGYVFYHNQDNENLESNGKFYLAFGGNEDTEENFTTKTWQVGNLVANRLKKFGLEIEWDNKPETRIRVTGVQ